ncbi:MAG TPA: peptide ABC transporter substrate-binding protein [Spongiibacteraceae bacterium]|nr:peptide ABC transporter substrate-binding protein [Spongiibacteraceae bacterium]HCS27022.1 peptide ABC transporter substrate-binding protein [Spongiibacteraceae bacterium]
MLALGPSKDKSIVTALLTLNQASCHFGRGASAVKAVDRVSLTVAPGEVLGLVGESGSGKSTLGRLVAGLLGCEHGDITLAGERLPKRFSSRDFRRHASRVQMVFQDAYSAMNPRMTLIDCLVEPLKLQGKFRGQESALALEWLDRIGLPRRFAQRYPHELSGGQRQRVGIARAFISGPQLVICDEPVSALDVSVQAQVVNLLHELQQETGVAMIFIAHDLAVVSHLADRTAVMYHGRIVETGGRDLLRSPGHPYTQALIAASPGGESEGEWLEGEGEALEANSLMPPADQGCAYNLRCKWVVERCRTERPRLAEKEIQDKKNGRLIACHLLD